MSRLNIKKIAVALLTAACFGGKAAPKTLASGALTATQEKLLATAGTSFALVAVFGGYLMYDKYNKYAEDKKRKIDALTDVYPLAKEAVEKGLFKDYDEFREYVTKKGYYADVKYAIENKVFDMKKARELRKEQDSKRWEEFFSKFTDDMFKKAVCERLAEEFKMRPDEFVGKYNEIIQGSSDRVYMELAIKYEHIKETNKKKFQEVVAKFDDEDLTKIVSFLHKKIESNELKFIDSTQVNEAKNVEELILNSLQKRNDLSDEKVLYDFKIAVELCDNFEIKKSGNKFTICAKNTKCKLKRTCSVELNNNQVILDSGNGKIGLNLS